MAIHDNHNLGSANPPLFVKDNSNLLDIARAEQEKIKAEQARIQAEKDRIGSLGNSNDLDLSYHNCRVWITSKKNPKRAVDTGGRVFAQPSHFRSVILTDILYSSCGLGPARQRREDGGSLERRTMESEPVDQAHQVRCQQYELRMVNAMRQERLSGQRQQQIPVLYLWVQRQVRFTAQHYYEYNCLLDHLE